MNGMGSCVDDAAVVFFKEILVTKALNTAAKHAGIRHVFMHVFRHTLASHLVMAGVDLRTVQQLMGHKDIKMTMRYAHLAPDHLKGAVERLDFSTDSAQPNLSNEKST